jgi:hypothetical protein
MTDLPSVLKNALGTVFEAATGKESDGISHKGCFGEVRGSGFHICSSIAGRSTLVCFAVVVRECP